MAKWGQGRQLANNPAKGRDGNTRTGSNADGIGARVYLTAETVDGSVSTQVQEALGSSTFYL